MMDYGNLKLGVIITAGGTSSRYGSKNKLLEKINEKEVILHSLEAFLPFHPCEIVISASESLEPVIRALTKNVTDLKIVRGGASRQDSVFNALKSFSADERPDIVAIHDAARPLIKKEDIEKCIKKALDTKAAIVAVKAVDTIKKTDENGKIVETPDRNYLWAVQTPQIFDFDLIFDAHKKLAGQNFSDDAGLVEFLGNPVYVVEGSYSNIKITTQKDLFIAKELIKNQ